MALNGNGNTSLILFLAGLIASLAAAYVFGVEKNINFRVDTLDKRLERIEEKLDRALLRRTP